MQASDLHSQLEEFDKALGDAVDSIYDASVNKTNYLSVHNEQCFLLTTSHCLENIKTVW